MVDKKMQVLLHTCCAPCAPYVIDVLENEYNTTLYFYNPNIHPSAEYSLRVQEIRRLADDLHKQLIIGDEDTAVWFSLVKGFEQEPERGKRCEICFKMRLESAFRRACELSIPFVATTLTVSPHKSASTINAIGKHLSQEYGVGFIAKDFKKQDGFRKTCDAGKKYNFYRQNYCGCIFSKQKDASTTT